MRKSVSPVVSTTLLVLLVIIAGAGAFLWIRNTQATLEQMAGEQAGNLPISQCSELQLISVRGDGVTVGNTGCDTISDLNLFIDDQLTEYNLQQPLGPGNADTINFGNLKAGETHSITIALGNGKIVSEIIEDCSVEEGCTEFNFTVGDVTFS